MLRPQPRRPACAFDELLLRTLSVEPASGHALTRRLSAAGCDSIPYLARTTYLGLHRLERQGLLTSSWCPVRSRALKTKSYRVTAHGIRVLGTPNAVDPPTAVLHPITILVAIAVISAGGGGEARDQPRKPLLTILVTCRVSVPADEVRRASMDVMRLLGAIGVAADWVIEKPSAADTAPALPRGAATGFVVHVAIVARSSGMSFPNAVPLGLTPPGADTNGADIVVFHDHIQEFAAIRHAPSSLVLALVVAHEIGHALLPAGHAAAGLMQSEWDQQLMDQADRNELRFTANEGALMRERLSHCCGIPVARR